MKYTLRFIRVYSQIYEKGRGIRVEGLYKYEYTEVYKYEYMYVENLHYVELRGMLCKT